MSYVSALRDGETVSHKDLLTSLGFRTERALKEWINDHHIPYMPVNGVWWIAAEDIRKAMRLAAQTYQDRKDEA